MEEPTNETNPTSKPESVKNKIARLIRQSSVLTKYEKEKAASALKLINNRQSQLDADNNTRHYRLDHLFGWVETEPGFEFWAKVHKTLLDEYKADY